nr:hypothetical protein [Orientia tsutsugamushi]
MQYRTMVAEKINIKISVFELNKYQEAIENFHFAIQYKPNCIEAYYNKVVYLLELNNVRRQ